MTEVQISISEAPRLQNGFATVGVHVPDHGIHEVLDLSYDVLSEAFGTPEPLVLDFLLVAGITYVLDKAIPRRLAEDFWTRQFELEYPVSAPARWKRSGQKLAECLAFVTGDEWTISFGPRPASLYEPAHRRRHPRPALPASAVSLLSGGLDSLIGVIDALEGGAESLLLIGHHDATLPAGDQQRLWSLLDGGPYTGRTDLRRVRLRPLPKRLARPGQSVQSRVRETTLRSRSLVFFALGVFASRSLGRHIPLLVPENGFIAINIPLTPSRIGTCSTRTTHPFFVESLTAALAGVGLDVPITNPLGLKTKGEAMAECRAPQVLTRAAPESVSCAHPSRREIWRRRSARNCGYCVPCLIRRAALHHVGADHGHAYGIDVWSGELDLDLEVASDVRAMLDCLDQVRYRSEVEERVLAVGPLPLAQRGAYIDMVTRGLDELRMLVRDKATVELQRRAGIR